MPRRPDAVITPNTRLGDARRRLPSPVRPGQCLSRAELADAVNATLDQRYPGRDLTAHYVDFRWIGKLERGEHRWPSEERRTALRHVLGTATDTELGLYSPRRTDDLPLKRRHGGLPSMRLPGAVEHPATILGRVQAHASDLTDTLLDDLDGYVSDVVEQYEQRGPSALAPNLVSERQLVQPLLHAWHRAHHRDRLFRTAARMSGQLSYMATNLGHFDSARAYGVEAFALADHVNDDELRAWIRGTQSLAEYYTGAYDQALELARDGRRYAGRGRQAVRLAVNGEARALGKLGERQAVDHAIGEAYDLLDAFPRQPGMTPCISFGLYSEARTAANAATARLAVGQPAEALIHAGRALEVVDASPSIWSRTLVRLDMAAAVTSASRPDLEHSAALMREAMAAANTHRIESIRQRTLGTARELSAWSAELVVRELLDDVTHWLANGSSSDDAT